MPFKNIELTPAGFTETQRNTRYHLYKGFSTVDQNNTNNKLYDFDLIKQNIINHFNTKKGERVMNPDFGTIIWDLIMEPMTHEVRTLLSNDITTICNLDPRVSTQQITVNEYDQGYLVEITLLMKSTDETSTMRLVFDQQLGLRIQ